MTDWDNYDFGPEFDAAVEAHDAAQDARYGADFVPMLEMERLAEHRFTEVEKACFKGFQVQMATGFSRDEAADMAERLFGPDSPTPLHPFFFDWLRIEPWPREVT